MQVSQEASVKTFDVGTVKLGSFVFGMPNRSLTVQLALEQVVPAGGDTKVFGKVEKLGQLPLSVRFKEPYEARGKVFSPGDTLSIFVAEDSAGYDYFDRLLPADAITKPISGEGSPDQETFAFPYFNLRLQQMPDEQLAIVQLDFQGTPVIHHRVKAFPAVP